VVGCRSHYGLMEIFLSYSIDIIVLILSGM
jgi:hypothetical protein